MMQPDLARPMPVRTWGEFLPPAARIQAIVVIALVLMIFWVPIRHWMFARWYEDPNWSHGFIVPVFSLYFLYIHCDELLRCRVNHNYWGLAIMGVGLLAYFYFQWAAGQAYPQEVALLLVVLGLVLLFAGMEVIRVTWFPIGFLIFAMPLPQLLYIRLTMPLREIAARVAALTLPLFAPGLKTYPQRVVIAYDWPARGITDGHLNIAEACSGMRLMMSFMALGVAMAYLHPRPLWHRILLLLIIVPTAVFCNTVRIVITGLLDAYGQSDKFLKDLSHGTPHALLGIAMLLLAFGVYVAVDWALRHLFVEGDQDGGTPDPDETPAA